MTELLMQELSENVVSAVKEITETHIEKIFLYGSFARGDFDKESDIDIMIILDCDKEHVQKLKKRMYHYASLMGMKFDREVSIKMRDKETFFRNQEILPFYKNIVQEGIVLYG